MCISMMYQTSFTSMLRQICEFAEIALIDEISNSIANLELDDLKNIKLPIA